ncbi:MAG TPA: hypothetical protein VFG58_05750 [Solirubrobacterales bacterium]|nr:hypothetical protein [Solirubrobacterales bacterium]
MTKKRLLVLGFTLLLAAIGLLAGGAGAATVRVGTLVLHADGEFAPRVLPRHRFAPIHFQGYGQIRETDGSVPPPLEHVKIDFDRDGHLTTAGLPVCPLPKLEGATTAQARQRCRRAIVGTGHVEAAVTLAGLARIDLRLPLTLFNGPRRGGHPTVLGHARAPFPISETYVIVAPIERIRGGIYGYRSEFDIPPIARGFGSLTRIDAKIGRRYRFHGRKRSYVSARCSDYILQTRGAFFFADGTVIYGDAFKGCTPRP